jgi:uncharacterized protein (TIGR01777 family)
MRILISGSHGLVGEALINSLANDGHEFLRLVRHASSSLSEVEWDPNKGQLDYEKLEGIDAVIHLAGESIASGRWTDEKKRTIRESRVKGTSLLSKALAQLSKPASALISASAIGYYGDRKDELLTETSAPGNDFLASVCVEWEKAAGPAAAKGIRVVFTRFGIILDEKGGALNKMLPPFRMGVGGKVGDGKQWMSWITLDDVVDGIKHVLGNAQIKGPVNFVAPNPVTNAEFTHALGKELRRPTFLPVPAFGARLAFGEMADALLLSSQKVEPKKLKETGYEFKHATIDKALRHVLS